MVFVYHFLSSSANRQLSSKANAFFRDVEKGKYIGIISTFTIAEYTGVLKQLLVNQRDGQVTQSEIQKVKEEIERFITKMGIILYDADSLASKTTIFGKCDYIIESSSAFKGRRDRKWHSIKGADALHVSLAQSVNAEGIATFDDDFRGASIVISPIMLSEVY